MTYTGVGGGIHRGRGRLHAELQDIVGFRCLALDQITREMEMTVGMAMMVTRKRINESHCLQAEPQQRRKQKHGGHHDRKE